MSTQSIQLPMVEIFETVEGEGTRAGVPTTFIRIFHCNLRCRWCDTTYSYAPAKPERLMTVEEIVEQVKQYPNRSICLTGGEPLIHGSRSMALLYELAQLPFVEDIHIETNGAIALDPFHQLRKKEDMIKEKVRFILDYKLPGSGEQDRMIMGNFTQLTEQDEIKFVIADAHDFEVATQVVKQHIKQGTPLFSPVWGELEPRQLVQWILQEKLREVRLNLQIHKYIWDPQARGV